MVIARRILAHFAHAASSFAEATALAGKGAPIESELAVMHARAACEHLVDAAALVSPSAGVAVAEAVRRAFDDAHRRRAGRRADVDVDACGLDEWGAASCAPEGTGGHVVDVVARAADEERLGHEREGSASVGRAAFGRERHVPRAAGQATNGG